MEADDLESICVLGRGAYGVVEKMKHRKTGTVLAVKVSPPDGRPDSFARGPRSRHLGLLS